MTIINNVQTTFDDNEKISKVEKDINLSKNKIKLSKIKVELNTIDRQDFPRSSNVARLAYDRTDEVLYLEYHDGSVYQYLINFETFENVLYGRAICKTEGQNENGRWFVGKSPSVGAAVHRYLIDAKVDYRQTGFMP